MRYLPSCGVRVLSFLVSPLSTWYVLICGVDLKATFFFVGVVVEGQLVKGDCVVISEHDFQVIRVKTHFRQAPTTPPSHP